MKTKTLLLAIAALSIPALAQAEEGKCEKGKKGCDKRRAHIIEKFDTDGDGKLSEEERKAAREAMEARKAEFIAKHDTDGDGKLSDEEKKAAKDAFIAQYDTDGDGELSAEEREAAREAGAKFPFHHKKRCQKGKRGPRGGGAE
ncbi:EF-hand domain-containing protein [Rubritalea tangerina]|uniref:EF-hand domain-containing protein n=2 Tax=Rubritalea tangerina TaxID=430798 RepID=A0ABW4Z8U8_9BACT